MDTATAIAWTPPPLDPVIESCPVQGHRPKLRSVRKREREAGEHKPTHSIRMDDDLWDELGQQYGERSRSGLFEGYALWLLRKPGGKLAVRKTQ